MATLAIESTLFGGASWPPLLKRSDCGRQKGGHGGPPVQVTSEVFVTGH